MSRRDASALLWDLIAASDAIASFTEGRTFSDFVGDAMLRAAVERQLITIGEVFRRLDGDVAASLGTPAHAVIGMRNTLVHAYDSVEQRTVYLAATRDVPALRVAASVALASLADG